MVFWKTNIYEISSYDWCFLIISTLQKRKKYPMGNFVDIYDFYFCHLNRTILFCRLNLFIFSYFATLTTLSILYFFHIKSMKIQKLSSYWILLNKNLTFQNVKLNVIWFAENSCDRYTNSLLYSNLTFVLVLNH